MDESATGNQYESPQAPADATLRAHAELLEEYLRTTPDSLAHVLRPLAALDEVIAVCESIRGGRQAPQPHDRRSLRADVQRALTGLGPELRRALEPTRHDYFHGELADLPELLGSSVLEHLLGDDATVPPDRGLFLERTRRMHPDVCRFVSEVIYDGRLLPLAGLERQRVDGIGAGIRHLAVEHDGNSQASPEEADAIAAELERLVGREYTAADGLSRPLRHEDVMVVAPYNMQVRCLRARLPEAVRVGTVDKFQGQQAPVVFYSTTSSSGTEIPRGLEFLLSRNRLNVAISRAQCLAYLVGSPRLLDVRCRTVEQMRMANALCRAAEMAEGQPTLLAARPRGDPESMPLRTNE